MSHPQWLVENERKFSLIGELDRETVPELWIFLKNWQPQVKQIEISLQQVVRIDSAGMVLLIHLIEHAKVRNCHIMLSFVPGQLRTLFQLSNIEHLMSQHIAKPAEVNCG
ncbi:lipid asymmetry maintenance protein MlaB [Vibrio mimicus]|uniref:STAS domain-containing protein n=1 Tax=Vibrio mimicus TaxID=674 RepID=UPI000878674A|nr:lipid asymmetry maintenance protein MlaB [Vibrio mimicus]AOW81647.1 NTP-binding protein [Vibrio mimicus]